MNEENNNLNTVSENVETTPLPDTNTVPEATPVTPEPVQETPIETTPVETTPIPESTPVAPTTPVQQDKKSNLVPIIIVIVLLVVIGVLVFVLLNKKDGNGSDETTTTTESTTTTETTTSTTTRSNVSATGDTINFLGNNLTLPSGYKVYETLDYGYKITNGSNLILFEAIQGSFEDYKANPNILVTEFASLGMTLENIQTKTIGGREYIVSKYTTEGIDTVVFFTSSPYSSIFIEGMAYNKLGAYDENVLNDFNTLLGNSASSFASEAPTVKDNKSINVGNIKDTKFE